MRWNLSIFLALFASQILAQEGKLDSIRSEVRDSSPSSSDSKKKDNNNSTCDDSWFSFSGGDLSSFLENMFSFSNPDNYEPGNFVAYPYAEGWPGLMQTGIERNKKDGIVPATWEQLMSVRISVEDGNNFSGINRLGLTFLTDTMTHLGIGGSVNRYEETRNGLPIDHLTLGDINLFWRHFQTTNTQARLGIGARFLTDDIETNWGVNFVYSIDWFPKDPLAVTAQLEAGTLGNAWVFRATGRFGLVWKFSEIYAGYDYLHIGSNVLQGPMVGLRIWF